MSNLDFYSSTKTAPIPISVAAPSAGQNSPKVNPWWTLDEGFCAISPPLISNDNNTTVHEGHSILDNWPILNQKSDILLTAFNEISRFSIKTDAFSSNSPPQLENFNGNGYKNQLSHGSSSSNSILWNIFNNENRIVNKNDEDVFGNFGDISPSSSLSSSSFVLNQTWQDEFFNFTNEHFFPQNDQFSTTNCSGQQQQRDPELSQIIDRASKIPSPLPATATEILSSSDNESSVKEIFDEIYRECEQHVAAVVEPEKEQQGRDDEEPPCYYLYVSNDREEECQIELSNIVEIDIDQQSIDFSPLSNIKSIIDNNCSIQLSNHRGEESGNSSPSSADDFSESGRQKREGFHETGCRLNNNSNDSLSSFLQPNEECEEEEDGYYSSSQHDDSPSPPGGAADDSRKKHQNRKAASRYRSKRKQMRESLAHERQRLEQKNRLLKTNVEDIEREIAYLKSIVKEIRRKVEK